MCVLYAQSTSPSLIRAHRGGPSQLSPPLSHPRSIPDPMIRSSDHLILSDAVQKEYFVVSSDGKVLFPVQRSYYFRIV